jgi:Cys-rich repeat protein
MKKQLVTALGLMAAALTFGSGCLVVTGDGEENYHGGCYEDCIERETCQTYCDAWECWDECWYETTCDVTCPDPPPASRPGNSYDECLCDIDCVRGESCVSGACVPRAEDNNDNGASGLCQACESSHDCVEDDARCVRLNYDHSDKQGEKICSRTCETDNDCPTSFECVNVSQEVGVPAQCLPRAPAGAERTCTNNPSLECVKAKDCAVGESCVNNECVAPTTAECSANSECGSGEVCKDYKCVDQTQSGCIDRNDCAANEICIDGECVGQNSSCIFNSECDNGKCVDGTCIAGCTSHDDCGPYERCRIPENGTEGLCEQVECRRSSDCSAGEMCVDANCEKSCTKAADCEGGFVCGDNGYCEQDPNVECRTTAECAQDEMCMDGECKQACTCNQDCSGGQVCDLTNNTCVDAGGNGGMPTQCANDCDCPSGQTCNNNTCG